MARNNRAKGQALFRVARREFSSFHAAWFVEPGGRRADAVIAAHRAAAAIEPTWEYAGSLADAQVDEMERWLEALLCVPEIEKDWFGVAEYRASHRVKPA